MWHIAEQFTCQISIGFLYNLSTVCFYKVPMFATNNSWEIIVHIRLTRNEDYASFSPAWLGILTGRLGKFPSYSYPPHSPQRTWLGGRILSCSAGPVYFWCASDAVFGACLWMACTCLSQLHTGLWDVFLEAYEVLFSAGMPECYIQTLNPGRSGLNMFSVCFHYLQQKCGL